MIKDKKIIGITMGDAAGIGAEVILKALKSITHRRQLKGANFLIIGDSSVIRRTGKALGFSIPLKLIYFFKAFGNKRGIAHCQHFIY